MKASLALLSCLAVAQAHFAFQPIQPPLRAEDEEEGILSKREAGFFEQLIDHNDPSLGTFQQRYWWNSTYWEGPGSPVLLVSSNAVAISLTTGL